MLARYMRDRADRPIKYAVGDRGHGIRNYLALALRAARFPFAGLGGGHPAVGPLSREAALRPSYDVIAQLSDLLQDTGMRDDDPVVVLLRHLGRQTQPGTAQAEVIDRGFSGYPAYQPSRVLRNPRRFPGMLEAMGGPGRRRDLYPPGHPLNPHNYGLNIPDVSVTPFNILYGLRHYLPGGMGEYQTGAYVRPMEDAVLHGHPMATVPLLRMLEGIAAGSGQARHPNHEAVLRIGAAEGADQVRNIIHHGIIPYGMTRGITGQGDL